MPVFNGERFLRNALDSVLRQTHSDFELLVVDDGSSDSTVAIVQSYAKDPRIRLESKPNEGPSSAMNRGLALARSEWVAVMHADDEMMPRRLERQLAFVAELADVVVASTFVHNIDGNGRIIARYTSPLTSRAALQQHLNRGELIGFHHPAVLMRRDVIVGLGGYREDLRVNEDIELWNRVASQGHLVLVQPEFLLRYRIHRASTSVRRARFVQLHLRWLKECMNAARSGESEPSWEEFLRGRSERPLLRRIDEDRKDLAKVLYKAGVAHYAQKDYLSMLQFLLPALCLQPLHVARQVVSKLAGTRGA